MKTTMEIVQEHDGLKQFTCKKCGSVIEANKTDLKYWKDGHLWPMYECPKCHQANTDREELWKIIESEEKRVEGDATYEFLRKANRWWNQIRNKEGKKK